MNDTLQKLVIIGSVPAGKRLCHVDGKLFVDTDTFLSPVLRLIRREGRDRTIMSIRDVLGASDERLNDMMKSRNLDRETCPDLCDLSRRADMLHRALRQCSMGIVNLKITYAADASAKASLELIEQNAVAILQKAQDLVHACTRTSNIEERRTGSTEWQV